MSSPQEKTMVEIDLDVVHRRYGLIVAGLVNDVTLADKRAMEAERDSRTLAEALTAAQARIAELEGTPGPDAAEPPRREGRPPRGQAAGRPQ